MYLWVVVAIFVLGANSVEGIIGHVTSVALAPPSDAISCGTNVTITISDAYLTSANVTNIASVVLVSNTSQTTSSSECQLARNGSSYYVTIPSFSSCYKSLQKQSDNRTTVTYLVRVVTTPNVIMGVVVRDRTFVLELKCEFNSEVVVNLRPIVAVINRNDYVVGSMIQDFKAEMKLFSDYNFDTLLLHTSPYMVVSGDYIYVGVWINFGPKANTTLQAHQCWATRTMDPKGNPKYHIISDNCPRTDPLDPVNGIRVKKNFVDNQVQFAFKAFNWLNTPPAGQHIYVHCYMSVCDSQIEQNCQNSGCSRRRRAIATMTKDASKIVTMGPINVAPDDPDVAPEDEQLPVPQTAAEICEKANMDCHFGCVINKKNEAVCVCPSRSRVGHDGLSCVAWQGMERYYNLAQQGHRVVRSYVTSTGAFLLVAIVASIVLLRRINEKYL